MNIICSLLLATFRHSEIYTNKQLNIKELCRDSVMSGGDRQWDRRICARARRPGPSCLTRT